VRHQFCLETWSFVGITTHSDPLMGIQITAKYDARIGCEIQYRNKISRHFWAAITEPPLWGGKTSIQSACVFSAKRNRPPRNRVRASRMSEKFLFGQDIVSILLSDQFYRLRQNLTTSNSRACVAEPSVGKARPSCYGRSSISQTVSTNTEFGYFAN
jgi:hypothetical protein